MLTTGAAQVNDLIFIGLAGALFAAAATFARFLSVLIGDPSRATDDGLEGER